MKHSYTDNHGNVWEETADGYQMIHSESDESRAAAMAEIKEFARQRHDAAKAFADEFLS